MDAEAIREAVRNAPVRTIRFNKDIVSYVFQIDGCDSTVVNDGEQWEMLTIPFLDSEHWVDPVATHIRIAEARAIRESRDRLRAAGYRAQFNGDHWCFWRPGDCEDVHAFLDLSGASMSPDIDDSEEEPERWCACLIRHFSDRPDVLMALVNGGTDAT